MMNPRIVIGSSLGFLALSMPVDAQKVVELNAKPDCTGCAVVLEQLATLGSESDPVGFGPLAEVVALPRGRGFLVCSPTFIGQIMHYNAAGKYVGPINRRGAGPGEFATMAFLVVGPEDSVHAVAMGQGKYAVYTPDLQFARGGVFQAGFHDFAVLRNGQLFAAAPMAEQGKSNALHIFNPDGSAVLAFDPLDPQMRDPNAMRRFVSVDAGGRMWALKASPFEITRWSPAGAVEITYRGARNWLPEGPWPRELNPTQDKPPGQLTGLMVDAADRLWIFGAVASADWKPMTDPSTYDPTKVFDTIVEVFDPASGKVIAQDRLKGLAMPAGPGLIAQLFSTESGDNRIRVLRGSVRR